MAVNADFNFNLYNWRVLDGNYALNTLTLFGRDWLQRAAKINTK